MWLLIVVSFIWAFSFGLIKDRLAGLDPNAVAAIRLLLSLLVFLPFIRPKALRPNTAVWLTLIGAIQFGLMYVLYLRAFQYLQAYEVALFTIFTPLYVTLFDAGLAKRWQVRHLAAAALSVLAAGVLLWHKLDNARFMQGFLLIQGSNLCFAAGQIAYKLTRPVIDKKIRDTDLFAWLYAGASVVALLACIKIGPAGMDWLGAWRGFAATPLQWGVLLYLGILASGACFFLWNLGALKVNAGTLAVLNNLKIPLGVACALLFFGESAPLGRLTLSLALLGAALYLSEAAPKKAVPPENLT